MGPTPTSAAMVKMLAMGEMKVYAFNLKAAAYSMVGVHEFLMKDNVKDLGGKLPEMQCCIISKGEVMHIPQGWYVLELATKGPLCYGVRKSFMVDTVDGKSAYKKVSSLSRMGNSMGAMGLGGAMGSSAKVCTD